MMGGRPLARRTILCIGDSITEYGSHVGVCSTVPRPNLVRAGSPSGSEAEHGPGWVTLLARDYGWTRRADVLNRGFGGYTTRYILKDLSLILPGDASSVVAAMVMLGSNDHARAAHPLHVPLTEYESNMRAVLSALKIALPADAERIVLSPPPCDAVKWREHSLSASGGMDDGGGLGIGLELYVDAAQRAASSTGCYFVNVHREITTATAPDEWKELLWDGLHLSAQGNAVVHTLAAEALQHCGVAPVDLPSHRPSWLHRVCPVEFDTDGVPVASES